MARRTQSPAYRDRSHLNGHDPFLVHSSSNKFSYGSNSSSSSPLSIRGSIARLRRYLAGVFLQKHSKKKENRPWKKLIYRFFFCFILGILLGLTPFGSVVDIKRHDLPFEIKSPLVHPQQSVKFVRTDNFVREIVSQNSSEVKDESDIIHLKQLIIVTPTYNRALQAYFLNRLGQTLRLVRPPLLWIVVEMNSASMETSQILRKTSVMYRHLVCKKNSTDIKDRGVHQRNTALEHIEHHKLDGIVYFADDDNIYSLELFKSLREISRFGTWPVAMLAQSKAKAVLEGPVCNGSQVIGWHTNEKSKRLRRFHVDMSGFAFNSTIIWDPKRWHRPTSEPVRQLDTVKEGFQETTFIEQVVEDENQMKGLPEDCSRVMNWHLHLEAPNLAYPRGWLLEKNLDIILPLKQ